MSYVQGSDLLLFIDGKAVGHCTSHETTFSTETTDVAVKPLASEPKSDKSGLWKTQIVTTLAVSVSADGLAFYSETEEGYTACMTAWAAGTAVQVACYERGKNGESASDKPYLQGSFIIKSLQMTAPAGDRATYSIQLDNDGEVTVTEANLTL